MTQGNAGSKPADRGPTRLEDGARASLNRCAGRVLTDAEWARARGRLLEFMNILRNWDRQGETKQSEAGNVVVIRRIGPRS